MVGLSGGLTVVMMEKEVEDGGKRKLRRKERLVDEQ